MATTKMTPTETIDRCPGCKKVRALSDAPSDGITYPEPVCDTCRAETMRLASMTGWDIDYARAIANGWAD